jgi:hypothetical protein
MRADAGYFTGDLARSAHAERIGFAIGAKPIAPLWRMLGGIADGALVAATVLTPPAEIRVRSEWPSCAVCCWSRTPSTIRCVCRGPRAGVPS